MADFTQEQLEALNKSIAEGTLTVKYNDKVITYRSFDEMQKIRDMIKRDLNNQKGCNQLGKCKAEFNRGL